MSTGVMCSLRFDVVYEQHVRAARERRHDGSGYPAPIGPLCGGSIHPEVISPPQRPNLSSRGSAIGADQDSAGHDASTALTTASVGAVSCHIMSPVSGSASPGTRCADRS